MATKLTLSVVDQSPTRKGGTAADALRESVKLAQITEKLGYRRYWVAEHHNSGAFSGTSPELLIGQIAAKTRTIRVGSGGVMLPHYSSLKVAEQFRILEAFFPGRIDLGIGRAPGSDQLTAAALSYPRPQTDIRQFPQQVKDVLGFLTETLEPGHPLTRVSAQPGPMPEAMPEVWLLGSSDYSARLAAGLGLPFSFADFFGNTGEIGPLVVDLYRREFQPSRYLDAPKVNVGLQVMCAPTEDEAVFLGMSRNLNKAGQLWGLSQGLLSPEEAAAYPMPDGAREYIEQFKDGYVEGDPQQVRQKVLEIADRYGTDDVGIVTNCYSFESRVRSFALVAEVFGLVTESAAPMTVSSE